jgi:hypothetical protein
MCFTLLDRVEEADEGAGFLLTRSPLSGAAVALQ